MARECEPRRRPGRVTLTLTLTLTVIVTLTMTLTLTLTLILTRRSLTPRSTALRLHHFVTRSASECRRKKGDQLSAGSRPQAVISCFP